MGTCNFYAENALGIYSISDTYEDIDENGNVVERYKDELDWEDTYAIIRYKGETENTFPIAVSGYDNNLKAMKMCETETNWGTFGNGNAWCTETNVESRIVLRCGYYSGANFDYNILVETCQGDKLYLSDYDNVADLVEDYMNIIYDINEWDGHKYHWNVGTFKMQAKNIERWITKRIDSEIEKCEKFCKENADDELAVYARFSNGETIYVKVD